MARLERIDIGHSLLERYNDEIVRIQIREKDVITQVEAAEMTEAIGKLSGGKEVFVLILAEALTQFDQSSREYSASPAGNIYTRADAFVVQNLGQRMIANFYMKINKPVKPSRMFNSEKDAIDWFNSLK